MRITFDDFYKNHCICEISHLQGNIEIAELVYELNMRHCISDIGFNDALESYKSDSYSGFSWSNTAEGSEFWLEVLTRGNISIFYEVYPKVNLNKLD